MKKNIVLASVLILFSTMPLYALCTTTVPGGTISGVTWTESGSPYCIEGDLLVNNLTIAPGVKVQFMGNYVFEVQGLVIANGTSEKEIIFTGGEDDTVVDWQGIYFNNSLPGSQLFYCKIEESVNSGIRISNIAPTIRNSIITKNTGIRGGGIDVVGTNSFTLVDSEVSENSIPSGNRSYGGGIYVESGEAIIQNCIIDSNSVSVRNHNSVARGGGIYTGENLILLNSTVSNNIAYGYASHNYWTVSQYAYGGGIFANGTTTLTNSIISNNTTDSNSYAPGPGGGGAYSYGAGIFFDGAQLDIKNCIIVDNINLAAADGSTSREGGGIYISSGTTNLTNATIANNLIQGLRNNNGIVTAYNSIFWGNNSSQISGNATVTYSDVQGGYLGEGNIDLNPVFISSDNYHIDCSISPMIDAGTNDAPSLASTDIDGEPRICNIVDIGADECSNCEPCKTKAIPWIHFLLDDE